ncbi:hypothetical protein BGY98DRAFT_949979 [Russula aff. rugulosa BPL654]|nr:hypothetical protein BGY98DRAFT_949979 [Russula aff. rugulosa BPL654]
MQLLCKSQMGGSTISHRIFQKFTANENQLLVECQLEIVSRWALDLFANFVFP